MSVSDKDIAEQLDAVELVSNAEVSRRLRVHRTRVAGVRKSLGLPPHPPGPPVRYETREQVMGLYLLRDEDAPAWNGRKHLAWTGPVNTRTGTPVVNWNNTVMPVGRAQFEAEYGRSPEGYVKVMCGVRHCVEPTHLADRRIRAEMQRSQES